MSHEPSGNLIRELYARFGLAYYHSECLHRELCLILAVSGLPRRDMITRPRVEERLALAFSLTLGDVVRELEGMILAEYLTKLQQAVNQRNFLAHHFWYERCHLMSSIDGVRQLIAELDHCSELFSSLDDQMSSYYRSKQLELGVTDDMVQQSMTQILSGQVDDSLPDKETVRELDKKLRGQQRLVRVWEFSLPDGRRPLIFETQDRSLWQLSDVGLGWTRFRQVEPTWAEHPAVKRYLPADILPRPKDAKPWEYEFRLSRGAVLWVKPGKKEQTFRWGVRKVREDTERGTEPDSKRRTERAFAVAKEGGD